MTGILLIFTALSVLWIFMAKTGKGEKVEIVSNGVCLWTCDLSGINEELFLTVINDPADENSPYVIEGNIPSGSHYNVIRITSEGACIIDSDCATHICIHEGITSSPSKPLVCLPNKLLITVTGESSDTDAITY